MLLPRVERALEVCDEHAAAGGTNEVQVLLTQSLLILIYAEFEKKIHVLMQDRCTSVADTAMQQFAMSCFRNVFRSLKTSELSGLLGRFGESHKRMFADALDEKCRNMYDSIVHQRQRGGAWTEPQRHAPGRQGVLCRGAQGARLLSGSAVAPGDDTGGGVEVGREPPIEPG